MAKNQRERAERLSGLSAVRLCGNADVNARGTDTPTPSITSAEASGSAGRGNATGRTELAVEEVPAYRKCGICSEGLGGVGIAYCTQGRTRYYKCDKCANTWKIIVRLEVVDTRPVNLQTR